MTKQETTRPRRRQWLRLRMPRARLRRKRRPVRRSECASWGGMRMCIVIERRGLRYAAGLARRMRGMRPYG